MKSLDCVNPPVPTRTLTSLQHYQNETFVFKKTKQPSLDLSRWLASLSAVILCFSQSYDFELLAFKIMLGWWNLSWKPQLFCCCVTVSPITNHRLILMSHIKITTGSFATVWRDVSGRNKTIQQQTEFIVELLFKNVFCDQCLCWSQRISPAQQHSNTELLRQQAAGFVGLSDARWRDRKHNRNRAEYIYLGLFIYVYI